VINSASGENTYLQITIKRTDTPKTIGEFMPLVIVRAFFDDMYVIHSVSGERHESTDDN